MTRYLTVIAAAGAVALATIATPTTADAQRRGRGVAAGIIGLTAGAIIGSAIANRGYYDYGYGYDPGYVGDPVYAYEPAYGYEGYPAPAYGYRYGRYGGATSDITNSDRMMQGTR